MLVSAIMPTRGRPEWAQQAVACFLSQTFPAQDRELVIVDDADCPSFAVPPQIEGVEYYAMGTRLTIGAKRNIAASRSEGHVIIHFDDDDWSAPTRMEDQVTRLMAAGGGLTGYHSMLFEDAQSGERWRYNGHSHYALGTSLCYTREFWQRRPFEDRNEGEDNAVVSRTPAIISVDAGDLMLARIHDQNTSNKRKNLYKDCWVAV